jgi:hypothetical protein
MTRFDAVGASAVPIILSSCGVQISWYHRCHPVCLAEGWLPCAAALDCDSAAHAVCLLLQNGNHLSLESAVKSNRALEQYTSSRSRGHKASLHRASSYPAGATPPYAGIFVGGAAPAVLVAGRGRLVPHPAPADGAVAAFTPFHNPDCEQARLSFTHACGIATLTLPWLESPLLQIASRSMLRCWQRHRGLYALPQPRLRAGVTPDTLPGASGPAHPCRQSPVCCPTWVQCACPQRVIPGGSFCLACVRDRVWRSMRTATLLTSVSH